MEMKKNEILDTQVFKFEISTWFSIIPPPSSITNSFPMQEAIMFVKETTNFLPGLKDSVAAKARQINPKTKRRTIRAMLLPGSETKLIATKTNRAPHNARNILIK